MIYECKTLTPAWLEPLLIRGWYALAPLTRLLFGGDGNFCPICESSVRSFLPHKWSRRDLRAVCPVCLSHPRHRHAWLFFKRRTNLFRASGQRLLHFAPETVFIGKFRATTGLEYVSADLASPHAMVRMDITAMECEDESFDAVYCSHVLEHVAEDRKAIAEIHRVLRRGGWAIIQVPLSGSTTQEDLSVTDPRERLRLYGQCDHVRLYGSDIAGRLESAGFVVEASYGTELASVEECERYGFKPSAVLFLCTRPGPGRI